MSYKLITVVEEVKRVVDKTTCDYCNKDINVDSYTLGYCGVNKEGTRWGYTHHFHDACIFKMFKKVKKL